MNRDYFTCASSHYRFRDVFTFSFLSVGFSCSLRDLLYRLMNCGDSWCVLMKICRRKSKKPYLGKKNVYEYEVLSIGIPSRFHKDVEPFLGKDLGVSLKANNDRIVIVLEPRENVSVNRKTPDKNM